KWPGLAVGAVEVETGAVGLQPALPMRQPAIPGPDIEHIRAPRQRFEKAQPRMRLPEHFQQIVVGERQPPLSRAQPIGKTREILRHYNSRAAERLFSAGAFARNRARNGAPLGPIMTLPP